ncbi:MAG: Stp1/IreP family PP2C-type Ser/Thr phosphatase [Actinobacteria bacterium]|nr:Stp1/IreP family PP2C-type Ser/Thr phosphatase [Actinomycetota bacterium]
MRYSAATDIGGRRSVNEDSFLADGRIFAVADGMGGHLAGEVASNIAVDCLRDIGASRSLERALIDRFGRANEIIFDRARSNKERQGMGTTLTACVAEGRRLYIAHVGDSRLYRLRAGRLRQLTKDHSLVAQMIERGHLKPEEAADHPQRSVITRALGASAEIRVDVKVKEMLRGDRYLLATDGLAIAATDEEVASIIASEEELDSIAAKLIALANSRGGADNVTVVVFEPGSLPAAPRVGRITKAIGAFLAVAILAIGSSMAWRYLSSGFYLGEYGGRVAVYRGVPGSFAGFSLRTLIKETDVKIDGLPAPNRERLSRGMPVKSLKDAERAVEDLATLTREKR